MPVPVCCFCDVPGGALVGISTFGGASAHMPCLEEAMDFCRGQGLHPSEWNKALEALRDAPEDKPAPAPLPKPVQGKLAL